MTQDAEEAAAGGDARPTVIDPAVVEAAVRAGLGPRRDRLAPWVIRVLTGDRSARAAAREAGVSRSAMVRAVRSATERLRSALSPPV